MQGGLDLVLVTGAGASCAFGANRTPLPLMADFSQAIVNRLKSTPGYLEATTLEEGLPGDEFERRLGQFLRARLAFEQIGSVVPATSSFLTSATPHLTTTQAITQWHETSLFHLRQIVEDIRRVTYDSFNLGRVWVPGAANAYGSLFGALGLQPGSRVALATTNYDEVAEYALASCRWRPDSGEPTHFTDADPPVSVDRLLDGVPGRLPVLHLHGRLGWYQRADTEAVYFSQTRSHDPNYGVPQLILPDPDKSYGGGIFASLWAQFEEALRVAKRVLVLGHSLNDTALLETLRRNVQLTERIGVTVLPESPDSEFVNRFTRMLPKATPVPMKFADPLELSEGFHTWRTDTERMAAPPD
jgi:hypothetical protein